ncbi:MAG: hypothetical protein AAF552_06450 [Pseudomonadota bacterium]
MKASKRDIFWFAALAALMLATRGNLLGAIVPVQLHDASWAAFLLAGAVLRKPVYLALLATLALGLDYAALCAGSLDLAGCLKPSYLTLLGAWAMLWVAGRMIRTGSWDLATAGRNVLLVLAAITTAYVLTSGGFYLWSGHYEAWSISQFWNMSAPFFLVALGSTVGYTALGLLAQQVTTSSPRGREPLVG